MSEAIKALVNSKKYQDARGRIGERERVGDVWAPTRKAANGYLHDDEPIYVNGKIGGGMDRPRGQAGTHEEDA